MKTSVLHDVTFGKNGNSAEYQLYGWSIEEDGFNWTLGEESALAFPRSEAPYGYFVEMFVHPRTRSEGPRSQRLDVLVNARSIGHVALDKSCTIAFHAPALPPFDRRLVVTLRHPDGFRAVPDSPDFAISFGKVRILKLEKPVQGSTCRSSSVCLPRADEFVQERVEDQVRELTGQTLHQLLVAFEMLSGNCEFGGVQRLLGAEPLGLLRFAGAVPETAIRGLDCGFAGIGETVEPFKAPDGADEWMVADRAYDFRYHTRMPISRTPDGEAVARAEKRKVAFLLRKFREDLSEGTKIYVCADGRDLPPEAMLPLFLALRRHGSRRLLWVTEARGDGQCAETVKEIYPGLMRGSIGKFVAPGLGSKPLLHDWVSLLTNAWLLAYSAEDEQTVLRA